MNAKDSKVVTMEDIQAEYEFEDKLKRGNVFFSYIFMLTLFS